MSPEVSDVFLLNASAVEVRGGGRADDARITHSSQSSKFEMER
jgi:hypothetical protein